MWRLGLTKPIQQYTQWFVTSFSLRLLRSLKMAPPGGTPDRLYILSRLVGTAFLEHRRSAQIFREATVARDTIEIMTKQQILSSIIDIGVVPVVRTPTAEAAIQSIEAIFRGGIRAAEITMTVPGAIRALEKVADQ